MPWHHSRGFRFPGLTSRPRWVALAVALSTAAVMVATRQPLVAEGVRLSPNKLERASQRAAIVLQPLGLRAPLARPRLLVLKAARRLTLLDGDREVLSVRVGLGPAPEGPKRRRGDGRTPEGDYRICTRNARSRFHLFLGLSYPSPHDADRALTTALISAAVHRTILAAAEAGQRPPWGTSLGGEVGIHGNGGAQDWTLGCIALDDQDIEVLWALCPLGTPVHIDP
jgi:L,D-peptidoglycan transpeptidase YkuD (ErfK/YbiS/YcfS/YnhG family)